MATTMITISSLSEGPHPSMEYALSRDRELPLHLMKFGNFQKELFLVEEPRGKENKVQR